LVEDVKPWLIAELCAVKFWLSGTDGIPQSIYLWNPNSKTSACYIHTRTANS